MSCMHEIESSIVPTMLFCWMAVPQSGSLLLPTIESISNGSLISSYCRLV